MNHFAHCHDRETVNPVPPKSCLDCPMRNQCLPRDMTDSECARFDRLVTQRHQLLRGEHLYRTNDPVRNRLYAIQSGQFKTYHFLPDGEQRVAGFQFQGDFLGLDSIGLTSYRNSTLTLSNAVLCEFSHARLIDAAATSDALAQRLRELLSKQLGREQGITMLLANRVEQKISGFLLDLPMNRPTDSRLDAALELTMTRADIGDYLGLAEATVSRTLSSFQKMGFLTLRHRQLTIIKPVALCAIAAGVRPTRNHTLKTGT